MSRVTLERTPITYERLIRMNLVAAPCLIATRTTPIIEVIHLMQTNNRSFVLIKDSKGLIVGIFTDRDLLMKFDLIVENNSLNEPVYKVMSRPVQALSIDLIHTAIEFMHSKGIRHVPIATNKNPLSESNLSGIITINQIVEPIVKMRNLPNVFGTQKSVSKADARVLGVTSPDG